MITCSRKSNKHKETSGKYDNKGKERLLARLKKDKKHVVVMFLCMNVINTYFIQRINARVKHNI